MRERERKYTNIFTVIGILLSVKISQDAKLFFNCVMYMQWFESLQKLFSMPFPTPWKRQDLDTSPIGHFPDRHFPELTFPRAAISPTGHFSDWTFPRLDISRSGYLPNCTFPRLHFSPFHTYYFRADIALTLNNLFLTGYFWQFKCRKCLNFLVNEW